MAKLYMLVGVPGSGKSTWVANQKFEDAIIASSDAYIDTVAAKSGKTYNEIFSRAIGYAQKFCDSQVQTAINKGANVKARKEDGSTPLAYAARYNQNPKVITTLLKAGADVNARKGDGSSPLMIAAWYNSNPEVVATLLKAGADAKARDSEGNTALDYAQANEKLKGTDAYWKLNDAQY